MSENMPDHSLEDGKKFELTKDTDLVLTNIFQELPYFRDVGHQHEVLEVFNNSFMKQGHNFDCKTGLSDESGTDVMKFNYSDVSNDPRSVNYYIPVEGGRLLSHPGTTPDIEEIRLSIKAFLNGDPLNTPEAAAAPAVPDPIPTVDDQLMSEVEPEGRKMKKQKLN